MNEKKRLPIVVYWILMMVLFVAILFGQQYAAAYVQNGLSKSRFGENALFEILWAGLVLIVVLLFKNKYIFTQKREGFFRSVKYVIPELLLSSFFAVFGLFGIIINNNPLDFFTIVNLVIYCLFIGIVEEFLCRGWLLNEFLERYSRNRKEIILSIIFSSFIFGVIHFINIGETQGFFETLVQVMNAAAGGIFLSLVYYKTKNIWVVVATHAIWDFSLFLSQANSLGDCLAAQPTTLSIILNVIRGIVLSGAYLFFIYWLYRQTDLYQKEKKSPKDYLIGIGVALYIIGLFALNDYTAESICPHYTRKLIRDNYQYSYYVYDQYSVEDLDLVLREDADTKELFLDNRKTGEYIILAKKKEYRSYLLVENDNYFTILIQTSRNVVLYGNYAKTDALTSENFLQEIKDGLEQNVVPDIAGLGVLEIEGDSYRYPMIRSTIGEQLYFDGKGSLYLNK